MGQQYYDGQSHSSWDEREQRQPRFPVRARMKMPGRAGGPQRTARRTGSEHGSYGERRTEPYVTQRVERATEPVGVRQTDYGMSMHDFMRRTASYEEYVKGPVPFSPRLRRATWIGMLLTLGSAALIILLPLFAGELHLFFFPWIPAATNAFLLNYVYWLGHIPLLGYELGVLLVAGAVLVILTRGLRQGNRGQLWIAFAEVIGGCINLLLILPPLAIIAGHVLGWGLIVLAVLAISAGILRLLSPRRSI